MDRIVYTVVSEPGGVDGRDPSDKGGKVAYATFDKRDAELFNGNDTRYTIKMQIVTDEDVKAAHDKLNTVEKLLLGLTESTTYRG